MTLQKYNVEVRYECETKMYIADLQSRAYLPEVGREEDKEFELVNMVNLLPITDQRKEEIHRETKTDQTLQIVKSLILKGWPNDKRQLPLQATPYYSIRDERTIQDGVILKGERVVIPAALRPQMKSKVHSSHIRTESCLRQAREYIFWPGMSAEIKQLVEACETCRKFGTSQQKETLLPHTVPSLGESRN